MSIKQKLVPEDKIIIWEATQGKAYSDMLMKHFPAKNSYKPTLNKQCDVIRTALKWAKSTRK